MFQNHYPRFRGAPFGYFRTLTRRPPSVDSGEASSSIRFSFGRFTTGYEVEEAARLIIRSLKSVQKSVDPVPIIRS